MLWSLASSTQGASAAAEEEIKKKKKQMLDQEQTYKWSAIELLKFRLVFRPRGANNNHPQLLHLWCYQRMLKKHNFDSRQIRLHGLW